MSEPIAWRWRYRREGARWTYRGSPVEDYEATSWSVGVEVEPLYAAAAPVGDEAIDEFLRDIYGHAFKEGAESTIHQWECAPNEPPAMPHGDCENEGSYQFVEDVKPKLRALLEGRSQ